MEQRLENLHCISLDWVKEKIQKSLVDTLNKYYKQEEEKEAVPFLGNDLEKVLDQLQSAVERE